jgi:hypothetical protein
VAVVAAVAVTAGVVMASAIPQEYQAPKPTKFHEFMKQVEGSWESQSEFQMDPSQPPAKSKGTQTDRLVCNGLFIVSEVKSQMAGAPFEGHGIMGYDTLKKKYVGSWVDNMSTAIWTSEGTVDEAGKVFTAVMEGPDPMSGKPFKFKMVTEVTGKDSKKMTFIMTGEDGKEHSTGKIEYTRKK